MAKRWTMTSTFDASADQLLELMSRQDFLVEQHKLDEAVIDATVEELSRSEARLVQELYSTEYGRGMKGIDRSKRERSTVTFDWDLKARRCTWTYKGNHGGKVQVFGEDHIAREGDRSKLTTTWNVAVKIPLIGGQIEKLIAKEVESGRPGYVTLVQRRLSRM